MNIEILKNNIHVSNYLDLMQSYHFQSLVSKPTRFPTRDGDQSSLLDHVWINEFFYSDSGILLDTTTDHLPLFLNIPVGRNVITDEKVRIDFRQIHDSDKISFFNSLCEINWNDHKCSDPNMYFNNFLDTFNDLFCSSFPPKSKLIS